MKYDSKVICKDCGETIELLDSEILTKNDKPYVICSCGKKIGLLKNTNVSADKKPFIGYLKYILKHDPTVVGLSLRKDGYVNTEELVDCINKFSDKYYISLWYLKWVVESERRANLQFSNDYKSIRAISGHTVRGVRILLNEYTPKGYLYYVSSETGIDIIRKNGCIKRIDKDKMVHLSVDYKTARELSSQREGSVVCKIDATKMCSDGFSFYVTPKGVVNVNQIPIEYVVDIGN